MTSFKHLTFCLLTLALICMGQGLQAQTQQGAGLIRVNSLNDPGMGGCDVSECTLREALAEAQASSDFDFISFQSGLTGTITLSSELLIDFPDVAINGPGADLIAISGNNAHRVLRINNSDASIRGLTIRDGNSGSSSGAGVWIGGEGTPLLDSLRIINNNNSSQGAGIWVFFSGATLRNLEIADNNGALGALLINGSAGDDVLVENVTISGNTGNQGASGMQVLSNAGQTITIRYLTSTNNTGAPRGNTIDGSAGVVNVEASVFSNNGNRDLRFGNAEGSINNSVVERPDSAMPGDNNLLNQRPFLGSLQFFAGSVLRVHPLGIGPGVDHVDDAIGDAGCGMPVTIDQIGQSRPIGPRCDAGAFELPPGFDPLFDDRFEELP